MKYGAKYVSLKTDDPYEITPERALEVIREKEIADANRLILDFPDAGIQVLNGRYGPYITDKARNAKIPKDKEPKSLTLAGMSGAAGGGAGTRQVGTQGRKRLEVCAQGRSQRRQGCPGLRRDRRRCARCRCERSAAPVKLAAKGKKSAVNKRAPVEPSTASKGKPKGKNEPKARKKSPAKKKS